MNNPNLSASASTTQSKPNSNSLLKIFVLIFIIGAIIIGEFFIVKNYVCKEPIEQDQETQTTEEKETPKGMMVLIEYKDTVGLVNFVSELYQRNIPSALLATPEFVQDNCEDIKKLTNYGMEIIGSHTEAPLWDMPYEEQYERISEIKSGIEECTGKPLKIVGSRFFASDENTVKVAEELSIPYVTARGTTGTKATVYDPEDYDVKILSISNIETVEFEYGSLCDYSYWVRQGSPDDMMLDLLDATTRYDKLTPVSHTNIGGYLENWMDMWISYWDENEVEWISLNNMMESTDYTMPFYKIPQNRNAPYTPKMLEHVESDENIEGNIVDNPCAIEDLPKVEGESNIETDNYVGEKLVMFHNGTGSMCLEALEFIEEIDYTVEEHLNTESDFWEKLNELQDIYGSSEGVSTSFGYYPIIFIQDKAYSGFNEDIQNEIQDLIE